MNERGQVLIVDDEPDIANFIQGLLQDKSYNAKSVFTSEEALSFLEKCPTDIMITDIRMPGIDGLELMRQARESQPDLSCMIITGHGDMDTAVQAIRLGAADFFTKPFDFTKLEKAVENEINRLWLMREIRQQQTAWSPFSPPRG
jgi:DNA-binding NtrC family response regulator